MIYINFLILLLNRITLSLKKNTIHDHTAGQIIVACFLIFFGGLTFNNLIDINIFHLYCFFHFNDFTYLTIEKKAHIIKSSNQTPNQKRLFKQNPEMILFLKQRVQKYDNKDIYTRIFRKRKNKEKALLIEQNKHLKNFGETVGKYYTMQSLHNKSNEI